MLNYRAALDSLKRGDEVAAGGVRAVKRRDMNFKIRALRLRRREETTRCVSLHVPDAPRQADASLDMQDDLYPHL